MVKKTKAVDTTPIEVQATEIKDDPAVQELQKIAVLDKSTEVAKFDPIRAAAAKLIEEIGSTVYDIATTDGEDTAKFLRRRCVSMRTSAQKVYETWNRPVLDAQVEMRKIVADIALLVAPAELVLDTDIKAREKIREDARLAKIAIEQARIAALRAKITAIAGLPAAAVLLNVAALQQMLVDLRAHVYDEKNFGEFAEEAQALGQGVDTQLDGMLDALIEREAESKRLAAESERLEAERQAQALAAKRSNAIVAIRGYPLAAMGLNSLEIKAHVEGLVRPTAEEFGDSLPDATSAFDAALTQINGLLNAALTSEKAADDRRAQDLADQQRRDRESREAAERQTKADAEAKILKDQRDAFELEQTQAREKIAADTALLAAERKSLEAQEEALKNPPAATPAPAPQEAEPGSMPAGAAGDAALDSALATVTGGQVEELADLIVLEDKTATDDAKVRAEHMAQSLVQLVLLGHVDWSELQAIDCLLDDDIRASLESRAAAICAVESTPHNSEEIPL